MIVDHLDHLDRLDHVDHVDHLQANTGGNRYCQVKQQHYQLMSLHSCVYFLISAIVTVVYGKMIKMIKFQDDQHAHADHLAFVQNCFNCEIVLFWLH